ncbi:MAG: hypothetical protein WKG07_49040 [Hymenobacter sp.]
MQPAIPLRASRSRRRGGPGGPRPAAQRRPYPRPVTRGPAGPKAIYHIWPDFAIKPLLNKSLATVKGDAAHASYAAVGSGIVWAVLDSGIEATHPHFATYRNLELTLPLRHIDFTAPPAGRGGRSRRPGLAGWHRPRHPRGGHCRGHLAGRAAPAGV